MSMRNRNVPGRLSVAQAVSSANAFQAEAGPSKTSGTNPYSFKAPAHKHAHHLHSIPPREKSTRTLIVDHMLWVHGRTRFAQARAELGMTDRSGGPTSSNYTHRRRPENCEEEEEVGSEGEDVSVLKGRREPSDDEEARLHAQDLQLARSLRIRAEGLEKVINSMLVQPPPTRLHFEDDLYLDPNQHTLPNGVRLRLALGTLINDFFTRQAPPPPFRHKKYAASMSSNSPITTHTSDSSTAVAGLLPPALNVLVPISAYGERKAAKRAAKRYQKEQASSASYSISQANPTTQISSSSNYSLSFSSKISSRVSTLYLDGADPETANSPPAFRCPRHLHTGCEICVEAKEPFSVKGAGGKGKARERTVSSANTSVASTPTPGSSFAAPSWPSTSSSSVGLGTFSSQRVTPVGIAPDGGGISGYQDPSIAGGYSGGVGEGLLKPAINGSALRRRTLAPYTQRSLRGGAETEADSTGTGYTKLSELLSRFLRLSALVSTELGREVKEGREGKDVDETRTTISGGSTTKQGVGGGRGSSESYTLPPSREWYHLVAGILTRATLQGYLTAGWRGVNALECLMGVGLGIDLEHTVRRAPGSTPTTSPANNNGDDRFTETGTDSQREVSPSSSVDNQEVDAEPDMLTEDEDLFKQFNPDELPSLAQAVAILFPSLGLDWDLDMDENDDEGSEQRVSRMFPRQRKKQPSAAEAEFANEMNERLRQFLEIPESTPDLSTHMEDLAWQYPAEPMERAATRFLEAVAGWRGKPELESPQYKKKPPRTWPSASSLNGTIGSSAPPIPLESLVHSNPTTPTMTYSIPTQAPPKLKRPSIDLYFMHPDDFVVTSQSISSPNVPSGSPLINNIAPIAPRNLSMDIPHLTASHVGGSHRRQSLSNTMTYSAPSHPQPHPRSSSFPQSSLGSTPPFPARSSQSPRSSHAVPMPQNHLASAPTPPSQFPFYSQTPRTSQPPPQSQSSGASPTSSMMPSQRLTPVGQQIPVWNAATGVWMPAAPSQVEMGSDVSGRKRPRSPERLQSMGMGPIPKRPR
ncbi:hypothetical protein D9757_004997 [Collybiopsis confluens]|uniref:Uncharacterized protein n=1 Tax=Collybiopsis confluens TaxID=2823264 RepID=A0A8H5HTQ4_9AGAR|nr:hypothetical protein D9757_004997 [Collybiopsis confluens]